MKKTALLAIYFPSFLSRYSIQMMLIALPWFMSNQHLSTVDISMALAVFYICSLIAAPLTNVFMAGRSLSVSLKFLMAALGLVCAATLLVHNPTLLILLRGLQGLITGMLRPLNQIWLLHRNDEQACPVEKARQAALSQVFIALGSILGAYLGARFASLTNSEYLLSIACSLPAFIGAILTPNTSDKFPHAGSLSQKLSHLAICSVGLFENRLTRFAIGTYILNLMLFKLWMVGYPMRIRQEFSDFTPYLPAILGLSPVLFLLGQLLLARSRRALTTIFQAQGLLLSSAILQSIFISWAMFHPDSWLSAVIIIMFGGFAAAAIYPSMQRILLDPSVKSIPGSRQDMQLVISMAADVGQSLGALALALSFAPAYLLTLTIGIGLVTTLLGAHIFHIWYSQTSLEKLIDFESKREVIE